MLLTITSEISCLHLKNTIVAMSKRTSPTTIKATAHFGIGPNKMQERLQFIVMKGKRKYKTLYYDVTNTVLGWGII